MTDWKLWGLAQIAVARRDALERAPGTRPYIAPACPACWRYRLEAEPDALRVTCEKCRASFDLPELDDQDRPKGVDH